MVFSLVSICVHMAGGREGTLFSLTYMILFFLNTGNATFANCEYLHVLRNHFAMYRLPAVLIHFSITALS